jgi:hypothetical protein
MLDRDDQSMAGGGAETAETVSADEPLTLTYRELGGRLGLSADGARALARRRGWTVARDGGRAVVRVSESELARHRQRRPADEGEGNADSDRSESRSMTARVAEMVAAIKAEPPPLSVRVDRSAERAEREKLIELMRQFIALYERERIAWLGAFTDLLGKIEAARTEMRALESAREQERSRWEAILKEVEAALTAARAATHTAERQHEQALDQHRRALADITIMHNDERSLWLLERRRLDMQIEALQDARAASAARWRGRHTLLLRAAAAAVLVALAGMTLVRDSSPDRGAARDKIERSEDRPQDPPDTPSHA